MPRARSRWNVEESLELSVRELVRAGLFGSVQAVRASLSCGSDHPAYISDPIEVKVELGRHWPRLELTYVVDGQRPQVRRDILGLERTTPAFGGHRWWFLCPGCAQRRSKLHLPPDANSFACRVCHRLLYLSQQLSPYWRADRRANRLAEQLGVALEDAADGVRPTWARAPRGMRRRTFNRLRAAYLLASADCDRALNVRIDRVLARRVAFRGLVARAGATR
jgi:hypothetical protein